MAARSCAHLARRRARGRARECGFEIGAEIRAVFDADRQPQQARRKCRRCAAPRAPSTRASSSPDARSRLSTPPSDSASVKQLQAVEERLDRGARRRRARSSASRRSRAAGARASACPRCVAQARTVHARRPPDDRTSSSATSAAFSSCARMRGASVRRPRSVRIAVERRAGEAEAVRPPRELLVQRCVLRDHRAADDVAVAVDVLRRRMHDDVGAERERPLQRRRQERVVDDDGRVDRVRGLRDVDGCR